MSKDGMTPASVVQGTSSALPREMLGAGASTSASERSSRQQGSPAVQQRPAHVSPKSYTIAVCLSGVFGVVGIHHFYLGRWFEGIIDFGMFVATMYCFITGQVLLGVGIAMLDSIHTIVVTIMLLIGSFKDGKGRLVCYPGQKLKTGI